MDYEKIAEFYSKAISENKLDNSLALDAKNISTEEDLKNFLEQKLIPIAKEMGYDFSAEDMIAYEKHVASENQGPQMLSDDELENVIGGASLKTWALGGALSLTAILGTGLAMNMNTASATSAPTVSGSTSTQITQTTTVKSTANQAIENTVKNIKNQISESKAKSDDNVQSKKITTTTQTTNSKQKASLHDIAKEMKNQNTKTSNQMATQLAKKVALSDTSTWMSKVNENTLLTKINIPGTHDSATAHVSKTSKYASCQSKSISNQLKSGIRALDLRVDSDSQNLKLCHGSGNTGVYCQTGSGKQINLSDVFDDMNQFLNENSGETLIVRIKNDRGSDKQFTKKLSKFLKNQNRVYRGGKNINSLTLGEARGKIIVISYDNLGGNATKLENWNKENAKLGNSKVLMQDDYEETTTKGKMKKIENFYNDRVWNNSQNDNSFRICFTSCVGSAKTETKIVKGGAHALNKFCKFFGAKKNVVDEPNIPNPKSVAKGINKQFLDFVQENQNQNFGIVFMDNPSDELIQEICTLNASNVDDEHIDKNLVDNLQTTFDNAMHGKDKVSKSLTSVAKEVKSISNSLTETTNQNSKSADVKASLKTSKVADVKANVKTSKVADAKSVKTNKLADVKASVKTNKLADVKASLKTSKLADVKTSKNDTSNTKVAEKQNDTQKQAIKNISESLSNQQKKIIENKRDKQ